MSLRWLLLAGLVGLCRGFAALLLVPSYAFSPAASLDKGQRVLTMLDSCKLRLPSLTPAQVQNSLAQNGVATIKEAEASVLREAAGVDEVALTAWLDENCEMDSGCIDGFEPTCEQGHGFGLCERNDTRAAMMMNCPDTCTTTEDTKGHGLHEENIANQPHDYTKKLPLALQAFVCTMCRGDGDLACCHNHPHRGARGRALNQDCKETAKQSSMSMSCDGLDTTCSMEATGSDAVVITGILAAAGLGIATILAGAGLGIATILAALLG